MKPLSFPWQMGGGMQIPIDEDMTGSLIKNQTHAVCFDTTQMTSKANRSNPQPGDPCHPLAAGAHPPAVAFTASEQSNGYAWERPIAGAITAQVPNDTSNNQSGVRIGMQVRRLTPVECARLQGFPDTYLDIPYRGKPAADGPKYKALGNSMAVPVMRWIGERIAMVETMITDREAPMHTDSGEGVDR